LSAFLLVVVGLKAEDVDACNKVVALFSLSYSFRETAYNSVR